MARRRPRLHLCQSPPAGAPVDPVREGDRLRVVAEYHASEIGLAAERRRRRARANAEAAAWFLDAWRSLPSPPRFSVDHRAFAPDSGPSDEPA